jgi:hypothetical protein
MVNHPMLVLGLRNERLVAGRFDELTNLAELASHLREAKGSRIANEFLLNGIGLRLNQSLDDNYYREALDYHLGLLFAHLRQPELAAEHIAHANVLPASGGDLVFSGQVEQSLRLYEHQSRAAARGIPSILIASMPRAGSVSLTQSLAATLDAPVIRISAGHFPDYSLIPSWLNSFSPGGAIAHDHFGASPFNLRVLREAGWRDVFVLARDPRASAASLIQLEISKMGQSYPAEILEDRIVETALTCCIPWIRSWLAAQAAPDMRLHWIKYQEATRDMVGAVKRVLDILRPVYPVLGELLDGQIQEVTGNFRRGEDEAWRSMVGVAGQRRLWEAISTEAAELLDLQP